jgi:hypothetical protein
MGINPALALAEITTQFNLIQADITKDNYCLIPQFIPKWEKAYGVSADAGNSFYGTQQQ